VLPAGYHHVNRRTVLGRGAARFTDAAELLMGWQMQLRSGLLVSSSSTMVAPDVVVVLGIRAGPFRLGFPCRVVYVVDRPDRQGFAYGTLPGHPESGEEAFVIERADDETVSLHISAFSKPVSRLARLAGPIGWVGGWDQGASGSSGFTSRTGWPYFAGRSRGPAPHRWAMQQRPHRQWCSRRDRLRCVTSS
jgi:uncharacterized protein (UPF0548 family)